MNRHLTHCAIVINLEGALLEAVKKSWCVLKEYGFQFIASRSTMPHIALASAHNADVQLLARKTSEWVNTTHGFDIKSNGLGVFVRSSPVIYLRWFLNRELLGLYNAAAQFLRDQCGLLTASTAADQWIPKTTLAFHDTSYNRLEFILKKLNRFNYEQNMPVTSLSLLELTAERECELERYALGGACGPPPYEPLK